MTRARCQGRSLDEHGTHAEQSFDKLRMTSKLKDVIKRTNREQNVEECDATMMNKELLLVTKKLNI
jgi:hypothetical protein